MDYVQFSECVNLVESYLKIEDVVARYANLKKSGEYYRCRCIFHDDDGESLIINPDTKTFYCPVCHAGGNTLKFLAMAEKTSLFDIIELQAKNFKLELYPKKIGFEEARFENNKRELAEIYEYAQDFYHDILTDSEEGAVCRKYLESRGISKFAIEKFNLGFVSKSDKKLTRFLYEYNFNIGIILESGLILHEDKLFDDKFQNCIVFPFSDPIINTSVLVGRIFDFDENILSESEGATSKYIYPKENSAFNRQRLIFGLNEAKKSCQQKDAVIMVEDFFDAVILSSAGFENVVAVAEKQFDSRLARLLTKYARRIIFCLKYGDKLELCEEILKAFASGEGDVFVAALPENPAEYLSEYGKDAFNRYIENPVHFAEYKFFERILSEQAANSEGTALIVHKTYIKKPAERKRDKLRAVPFLQLACRDIFFLNYVAQIIPPEIFEYEPHQEIFRYLKICLDEDSPPDKEDAIEYFDKESYREFLKIMKDPEVIEELKHDEHASIYLTSDESIIRMAAEDATEQLLRKIAGTSYINTRNSDNRRYANFVEKIGNLQSIQQTLGK